jgi:hypothetical protein
VTPAVVLSLALLSPAAPPDGPKLQRGDEFAYAGTVSEAVDRPGTRLRRSHEISVRVFVLECSPTWADAAVLTLVRRKDDAPVAGALPEVTGNKRDDRSPPAARLDLVRIHANGIVHPIAPLGPAPLRFTADTPAQALPTPPLDTFAPCEFGMFAPRTKAGDDSWHTAGYDFTHSERCVHLRRVEHAPDWDFPRGGQISWHRADDVWLSGNGMARMVKRSIRQRDGIAEHPAVRIELALELKEQGRPIGRMYDRYRSDIEAAYFAMSELGPLVKDAARLGPEPFKQRITRLDAHLESNTPNTPFREAVLAVRRQLEAARRGEAVAIPISSAMPISPRIATVGHAAPEIRSGEFTLSAAQGTPVVLVFFMPGRETAEPSMKIAEAVQKKFGAKARVAAFAVFAPARTGSPIPVHDGTPAVESYSIETFPRFFVVDAAGVLKWTFAGVGNETGFLVREQVENLLAPPVATGSPTGPAVVRPSLKP